MKNIILIGMPGSGKTTLGEIVAKELGMEFLDFDDDVIEGSQNKPVGKILAELGGEKFKALEEDLALKMTIENTVLGTSGSLPYSHSAMMHLKKSGMIIYLKVELKEIKKRFQSMKTERIIGMKEKTFEEIFTQREKLYTQYADIVFSYSGNNIQEISNTLIKGLGKS